MSSPMVSGIYYSRIDATRDFMWALVDGKNDYPAHFDLVAGPLHVVGKFIEDEHWIYAKPDKSYMIMPEDMYKW